MVYKVIQWATGATGKEAIRSIVSNSELELVGVRVYDSSKVGKDAGEIASIGPIGVTATDDEEKLLALDADCILWTGAATIFAPGADMGDETRHVCRLLESGKNLVSIVHAHYGHPASAPREMIEPVESACQKAGTSLLATGIDPGFVSEVLALTLTGISQRISSIKIQELLDYSKYANPQIIYEVMAFGRAPNPELQNGFLKAMAGAFGPSIRLIADELCVTVDQIQPYIEVKTAEKDFQIAAGPVKKGTVSAMRFGFNGLVDGKPFVIVEHITRLDKSDVPEWEQGEGYTIEIKGEPSISVNLRLGMEGRNELTDSVLSAAMHAVNAIPAVCQAQPGIRTITELPRIAGRHTTDWS